ncbi:MAG: glycosyltransferase, partial [Candidatus Nezhaarchaeota archaeon]|nr:glycosyltransferase [Candidatus Nezhaarchaeota archaeon]
MSCDRVNAVVVAKPFPFVSGGGYRALLSIKEYRKRGINTFLVLPWAFQLLSREKREECLYFLSREGIGIHGNSLLPKVIHPNLPMRNTLTQLLVIHNFPIKVSIDEDVARRSQCVISLHEGVDALFTCLQIGKRFSLKRIALLQSPPFYGNVNRIENIGRTRYLWSKIVSPNPLLGEVWSFVWRNVERETFKVLRNMLNSFDLILAVSKSIPIEMGEERLSKVVSLDPGVALSQDDLQMIDKISRRSINKEKVVVFGGRPSPEKGVIEGLIAWKYIVKKVGQDYRLVISGDIEPNILAKLRKFCYKLGIEDNVLFTGFISREEFLSIVAKAKMMLYPSHVDAMPYAVLEALYLN